ncbi:MAG: alpha/beta fold hydrolase BchO [Pseudomonadota bacterium]
MDESCDGAGPVEQLIGINAGGVRWHCRRAGRGPVLVLLHGTGASAHSWAELTTILARRFDVLAVDLPGHGQSSPGREQTATLPGMAAAVARLLRKLDVAPFALVGHSAGAAIAAQMTLDDSVRPVALVSVNGAFLPFGGPAGPLFAPLARMLARSATVARVLSRRATDGRAVERLMRSTGSRLDASGLQRYRRLLSSPDHVRATLRMMANWDLRALNAMLPSLAVPLLLVVGAADRTVPPWQADRVAAMCPAARVHSLDGLGHLAHEEAPMAVAGVIIDGLRRPAEPPC